MVLLSYGGDVTKMTTNDKNSDNKKSFTLRINAELSEKVEKEASSLGLTQNAYITMVLHKALRNEMKKEVV